MVVDVEATVLSNVRLSDEYNVLELEVPEIAAQTQPGQFLMVKPEMGPEPLLRRPFSIFEILHDQKGNPKGISLLNKRVGITTEPAAAGALGLADELGKMLRGLIVRLEAHAPD